jgi:hypothetical protein
MRKSETNVGGNSMTIISEVREIGNNKELFGKNIEMRK